MQITRVFTALALAGTAVADGKAITDAMAQIKAQATDLGNTITSWKGDLRGAIHIPGKSNDLLKQIKAANKVAQASEPLTALESIGVAQSTIDLGNTVNTTLQAIIDAKPRFDKFKIVSPAVLISLELQQDATDDFSNSVVSKVPDNVKDIAKGLIQPIDAAFANAIDQYRLFQ